MGQIVNQRQVIASFYVQLDGRFIAIVNNVGKLKLYLNIDFWRKS